MVYSCICLFSKEMEVRVFNFLTFRESVLVIYNSDSRLLQVHTVDVFDKISALFLHTNWLFFLMLILAISYKHDRNVKLLCVH